MKTIYKWSLEIIKFSVPRAIDDRIKTLLVTDIDDTLLDANSQWYRYYLEVSRNCHQDTNQKPISPEVFRKDGPRKYLSQYVDDYNQLKKLLINTPKMYKDLPILLEPSIFANLSKQGVLLIGYLSTRPQVLYNITRENLLQYALPNAPILLRPKQVLYEESLHFKLTAIQTLRSQLDDYGLGELALVLIDDYIDLINRINELGENSQQRIKGHLVDSLSPKKSWDNIFRQLILHN